MDTTLPSSNSALFNIPKLAEDGTNWITYKERMLTAIVDPTTGQATKADGTAPTQTEIDERDEKIDEFYQKDSLVKQQIFSTITDRLLLLVQKLDGAAAVWKEVCKIHEGKTELVQIDLRRRLQEMSGNGCNARRSRFLRNNYGLTT
ncbi:hypothetical protein PAXINDRAFT_18356 [Paxillus involutus ATCC 200175]|uniref:Uncharacterized protein n=1 Tax=Paxillus involutus ATCC 200175 TaxID=664439 RepID=A0A0C9TL71_PAXIN|nr:hypothetical protein PAXINDRAFT_18356 [Paxillus involutus ATCC 200175]